ncbi:uncharacterized protein LOC143242665 [Tachypleus tridentatus]|uniref:uncharacterized protein LOC143242665 n=1 Tax=Tachypleus tridentatus TaxID=6853 RepID=UPI003FD2C1CE
MKTDFESSCRQYLNVIVQRTLFTTCFIHTVNSGVCPSVHLSSVYDGFTSQVECEKIRMKSKFNINFLNNSRTGKHCLPRQRWMNIDDKATYGQFLRNCACQESHQSYCASFPFTRNHLFSASVLMTILTHRGSTW